MGRKLVVELVSKTLAASTLVLINSIDAIMKGMVLEARGREDSIEGAMQDLDTLMAKAKDMVSPLCLHSVWWIVR